MSNISNIADHARIVVFRVDDSDAIQGHDSGHDSEGVKREKTVNR
jgi:hypothetical protein